jgi:hypothetical protein
VERRAEKRDDDKQRCERARQKKRLHGRRGFRRKQPWRIDGLRGSRENQTTGIQWYYFATSWGWKVDGDLRAPSELRGTEHAREDRS